MGGVLDSARMRERDRIVFKAAKRAGIPLANSEIAANWLRTHGYALEPGGYIPGVGYEDGTPALLRRQAE
jgi:hypothetical protein